MDIRAYRVAQAFVAAQVREARYSQEFLQWSGSREFRNPATGNDVKFISLPVPEQVRIYQGWKKKNQPEEGKEPSKSQAIEEALDIARNGEIIARESLSAGGLSGEGAGVNVSEIVRMRHNGQDQIYIRKPAEGEEPFLRVGIPAKTYHSREQASFGIDQLMGPGGIVPPTVTRGEEDGSYQLWSAGSRPTTGEDLNELVEKVSIKDLQRSPSFHRMNVLDLIIGHEDRHRGNLMYSFDGQDQSPENLRLIGIDNGLALSNANPDPSHHAYVNPWQGYYTETEGMSWEETLTANAQGQEDGDQAVIESLSNITPKLHAQIKKMDLGDAAKQLVGAGVKEESAVRAALTRIAVIQENPEVFSEFVGEKSGNLEEAWQAFQHESGTGDLLDRVDMLDDDKIKEVRSKIDAAVEKNKPDKWRPKEELVNYFNEAVGQPDPNADTSAAGQDPFGDWGDLVENLEKGDPKTRKDGPKSEDPKTRKEGPKPEEIKTRKTATSLGDRWLRNALRRTLSER